LLLHHDIFNGVRYLWQRNQYPTVNAFHSDTSP
jgi:hypothetical protein